MAHPIIVALGANLGDRRASLARACSLLERDAMRILRRSNLYWTRPWPSGTPQGAYLNAAVLAETAHGPLEVIDRLLRIERGMGRVRRHLWEPRPIDLDLIVHGDLHMNHQRLALPHPRWHERDFVLAPLRDLGMLALPGGMRPPSAWLAALEPEQRCILSSDRWYPFP